MGFLVLCFIWGILRIVFWSTVDVITSAITSNVLLWIPLNIQFATFSLLVVFYAHLVHKSSWERTTKKRFAAAYIAVNAILIIMQSVSLGVVNNKDPDDIDLLGEVQSGIAGFVFLVLVAILAWYGYRLHVAISSTAKHQMLFQVPPGLFVVTVIIILLFSSRSIYDFVNVASKYVVNLDSHTAEDQLIIFFAYFFWEIVPAIMIIVLFWRIPTTHIGGITRRGKSTMFMLPPTAAVTPMPSAGIASRLFSDPQRYDSDDETTGFLHKGTPVAYTTPPKPSSYTYSFGKNTPYATTPTTPRDLPAENLINNALIIEAAKNNSNNNNDIEAATPVENSSIIPGNV